MGADELLVPGEVDVDGVVAVPVGGVEVVDPEVELPVCGVEVVEGAVCAIAAPANMAETTSEHSRIDFVEELFMKCLTGESSPGD